MDKAKEKGKEKAKPQQEKGKGKAKATSAFEEESDESASDVEHDDSGEESGDGGIIDVDFEFFNLKDSDYHSIKHFLSLLFEKETIELTELTELLLAQTKVGSAVKIDGNSDPYSFLSVLNLTHHKDKKCVQDIHKYLLSNTKGETQERLKKYLNDSSKHIGIIFNERLINMPIQTAPPMFKMLQEEIQWALEEGGPFNFEYYLFLMKTYKEKVSLHQDEDDSGVRKAKRPKTMVNEELFFFNEEEEVIAKVAELTSDYKFGKSASKWTLQESGIVIHRKIAVVHRSKIAGIIKDMEQLVTQAE